ncbi:MAG: class I SAM-dependent methyltransferase [Bellilinea sp.]
MRSEDSDDSQALLSRLVREIGQSRKYRELEIPVETLKDLLEQELGKGRSDSAALQSVREKLHNIVAPYLGDPDYAAASEKLNTASRTGEIDSLRPVCREIMESHASTQERVPLLDHFYERLWAVTGIPGSVLDLACGLHPFGLPWMGLPQTTRYYAYDLLAPRINLINHFFGLTGYEAQGFVQDILVTPPDVHADVGIFFKEAHRFEQRKKGCNRPFFKALNVRWLLVSLPAVDLGGHHSMVDRQRKLMDSILTGLPWTVEEILIENELIFCIQKS